MVSRMGLEIEKNRKHEPLVIEISEYEAIELVLSKIIIPFSEVLKASNAPDIYVGYEKIPFEKRDPMYKSIMRQEFADAMRSV
jgi:hypothetical protein